MRGNPEEEAIRIRRIYELASSEGGVRILIDRLWPRGISKEKAGIDIWMQEIAPSPELRKWFDHQPERFHAFKASYEHELSHEPTKRDLVDRIIELSKTHSVTLLYGAKDPIHNHAKVLHEWLKKRMQHDISSLPEQ